MWLRLLKPGMTVNHNKDPGKPEGSHITFPSRLKCLGISSIFKTDYSTLPLENLFLKSSSNSDPVFRRWPSRYYRADEGEDALPVFIHKPAPAFFHL